MCLKKRNKRLIVTLVSLAILSIGLLFLKPNSPTHEVNKNENSKIVYINDNKYIEYAEVVKSKMKLTSETIILKQSLEVNEKFGYDENNNITLARKYKSGFGIDNNKIKISNGSDCINVNIKEEDIKMLYCESISDIKVLDKKESTYNKFKDVFKSDDEQLLLDATNRLDEVAKVKANENIDKQYLKYAAEKSIREEIKKMFTDDINVNINFNKLTTN